MIYARFQTGTLGPKIELDEEDERIVRTHLSERCDCGGEIENIARHERDSSNDEYVCKKCGYRFIEMALWRLEEAIYQRWVENQNVSIMAYGVGPPKEDK